jgi:hypothetical protein
VIARGFVLLALFSAGACVPNDPKATVDAGRSVTPEPINTVPQTRRTLPQRLRPPGAAREEEPDREPRRPRRMSDAGAPPEQTAAPDQAAPAAAPPLARIREVFTDSFERAELGPSFSTTSAAWRIEGGRLCGRGARNHPVWLRARIPTNARIEFDASSASPHGDIKAEFWGDGKSAATSVSYTNASSYLTIFGGWQNQFHVLARIDEHAKDRPEIKVDPAASDLRARPVRPHQTYHFKVERSDGKTVRWFVDDIEILSFTDPNPLKGPGHEHFGFNNWEVPLCFDNLKIAPLGE